MVVNQKSKFEMKHNLSLFLGKIVDEFVNWLFDYLATANELKTKSTTTNAVDKSSPKSASPQVKGKVDTVDLLKSFFYLFFIFSNRKACNNRINNRI